MARPARTLRDRVRITSGADGTRFAKSGAMMPGNSSARANLTVADFAFVEAILVEELASPLRSLQLDPEAMTLILDLDAIHRAVVENTEVSPSLHLYILVRQAFVNSGIVEAEIADEVAGELVEKLGMFDGVRTFHFVCLIRTMANEARFHIQAAAGENFLILNGSYQVVPEKPGETIASEDRDSLSLISERCAF